MIKGAKLLLSGASSAGKTTLISKLEDSLVIVFDDKTFPFKVPHYKPVPFDGIVSFKKELVSKVKAYKDKFDKLPETVVFDTVTHFYQDIYVWAQENHKGFEIFNAMQQTAIRVNSLIEKVLVDKGINVVIVAHTIYNEGSNSFEIPSVGKFKESGGWLSLVDNASHISTEHNRRSVYHQSLKYPARSTVDMPEMNNMDDYDIQEHVSKIKKSLDETDDYAI